MANTKVTGDLIAAATITATNIASGGLDSILSGYLTTNTYATESYVTTAVANLVDAAPSTLDTLNELAAALGDDPNFATTVTNSLASKVDGTGTANYIPKFIDTDTIGNSSASDNGTTFDVSIQGKFTSGSGTRILTLNAPTDGGTLTFETGGTAYADMGSNKAIFGTGSATDFYLGTRAGYSLTLGTANTARLFLDTSGNVGIGTNSPYSTANHTSLTIDGTSVSRTEYRTGGTSRARFLATSSTVQLGSNQNIPLIFETGASSTERMRIDSSGNVGIGTTPAAWSTGTSLEIGTTGNLALHNSGPIGNLIAFNTHYNSAFIRKSTTVSLGYIQDSEGHKFYFNPSGVAGTSFTPSEKMRIDSAGRVGINTTATNYSKLNIDDLSETQYTATAFNSAPTISIRSANVSGAYRGIRFSNTAGSREEFFGTVQASDGSHFVFQSYNTTDGYTERVRIDNNGNVGIGTSGPAEKLTVSGNIKTNNGGIIYTENPAGGRYGAFYTNSSGTVLQSFGDFGEPLTLSAPASTGYMNFKTAGTERMRITSGGYLKVGRPTATESRHLMNTSANGNTVLDLEHDTSLSSQPYGLNIDFRNVSPDNNTNWFHRGEDSTAVRFYIYSDGDVWTSDAGTLTSDETLKNNITDATPKLDDVMNLRVRNYYWNEDYHPEKTDKKLIGFIAQEFEQVFPHLVSEHIVKDEEVAEDGTVIQEAIYKKGIKEGKLIPILVKAMQELKEIVDNQQQQINDLKAQLNG